MFVGKLLKLQKLSYASGGHKENLSTLHELRRTNVGLIEINHWAKVANKTANVNV